MFGGFSGGRFFFVIYHLPLEVGKRSGKEKNEKGKYSKDEGMHEQYISVLRVFFR